MPKVIPLDLCRSLIAAHDCVSFNDSVETEYLEFKSEPYRLDQDLQKQELAKDVSGLANAGGGLILIGFKTTKDTKILGDYVTELRPVPNSLFRSEQYQSIIDEWVYPAPAVRLIWVPAADDRGFGVIDVSAGDPELRPYLLKRLTTSEEKRVEIVIGYCERRRTNVQSLSAQEIHALLRAGRSAHEVGSQYRLIHDTLQLIVEGQSQAVQAERTQRNMQHQAAVFERDKRQALATGEFETIPNLLVAAYPSEPVQMRGLLDSSESDLIHVLHDPPRLKGNGWDLTMDRPIENIHGRLRRGAVPGWKLLQLSRDGVLMFLGRGDDGFLSYSLDQHGDRPYLLNPFVLAHCVYVFALFSQSVFRFATPPPREMIYVLELRNMTNAGKPALLHPNHGKMNVYPAVELYRPMPWESNSFQIQSPPETPPGEITYELVSEVYVWFGFDRHRVPYSHSASGKSLIDDVSLFQGAAS